jgi:hypothetical protein
MPTRTTAPGNEQTRRLRADAACLCQVIAAEDLTDGLWIYDLGHAPGELQGLAIGSGHAFSAWAGDRLGRRCVGVAASRVLEICRSRRIMELAAPLVESYALHELAHTIWGTAHVTVDQVAGAMSNLPAEVTLLEAEERRTADHGLRWAATLAVLTSRAKHYRRDARLLCYLVAQDLASYGWQSAAIVQCIGHADPRARLTDLLDPAGIIMRRLMDAQLHDQRPLTTQPDGGHGAPLAACFLPR